MPPDAALFFGATGLAGRYSRPCHHTESLGPMRFGDSSGFTGTIQMGGGWAGASSEGGGDKVSSEIASKRKSMG